MTLLDGLENGLFALGQVLRFPVMALLWLCVVLTLYYAGYSLMEAVRRRREHSGFDLKQWLQQGQVLSADASRSGGLPSSLKRLLASLQAQNAKGTLKHGGLENIVAEHEEKLRHALDGPRALVKLGPSLGLIGTLIPMGASLAAMASGNLEVMAGQMVVAFTSTIVGLATGTIAYALVALRHGRVSISIRDSRYLADVVAAELEAR